MTMLAEAPTMLRPEPLGFSEEPSPRTSLIVVCPGEFRYFCRFSAYLESPEALELRNSCADAQRHGLNVASGDDRLAYGACV